MSNIEILATAVSKLPSNQAMTEIVRVALNNWPNAAKLTREAVMLEASREGLPIENVMFAYDFWLEGR